MSTTTPKFDFKDGILLLVFLGLLSALAAVIWSGSEFIYDQIATPSHAQVETAYARFATHGYGADFMHNLQQNAPLNLWTFYNTIAHQKDEAALFAQLQVTRDPQNKPWVPAGEHAHLQELRSISTRLTQTQRNRLISCLKKSNYSNWQWKWSAPATETDIHQCSWLATSPGPVSRP